MAICSPVEWGDSNHMQQIVDSPIVRWALALAWTGMIMVLMLTPSDKAVVEETSNSFGGTDLTDTVGHVILFGVLALLWWAALACRGDARAALWRGVGWAAALGVALEIAQHWVPERGVSVLDLVANVGGAVSIWIGLRNR
jgi:VanZ family protein